MKLKFLTVSILLFNNLLFAQYDPTQLISPLNNSNGQLTSVIFEWSAMTDANVYRLQLSTNNQFNTLIYNDEISTTHKKIDGLLLSTTYYWRIKTTYSFGESGWSSIWSFTTINGNSIGTPCPGVSSITYAGKTYNTVLIGNQCWLKENLDIGAMIETSVDQTNNGAIEKYCYYNDPSICSMFGGLYTWDEAMQYSTAVKARGVCPEGWHIPSAFEITELRNFVNNNSSPLKMSGTNYTGFSALLTGYLGDNKVFYGDNIVTNYWGSSMFDETHPYVFGAGGLSWVVLWGGTSKEYANSIRCIKDETQIGSAPQAPTLNQPTNNVSGQPKNVLLSWNNSENATSYVLQVSESNDFNSYIINQSGLNNLSFWANNLNNSTTYYWRVKAVNNFGSSNWSQVWSFKTLSHFCGNPITYAGKTYNTVQIGNQCWLRENLNVGTMIQSSLNPSDNNAVEKYCYNNDSTNCAVYGGLYQWNEAMQYSNTAGSKGICPNGWHIPIMADYNKLKSFVYSMGRTGNDLKAIGQGTGAGVGTNLSGFSALLAGIFSGSGRYFYWLNNVSRFWASQLASPNYPTIVYLENNTSDFQLYIYVSNTDGNSIRCLYDVELTDVENKSDELPIGYLLSQNYPNPFNPTTIIQYSLPKAEFVTIKIFDAIGNQISVLVSEFKQPGSYEVSFDGKNLPSGVYYYQINTSSFRQTKKLVLVK